MNNMNLFSGPGTTLAKDDFLVVLGHRNDEIGGFDFFLQHVSVRLNIRTTGREAKGNSGQAMNDQRGYCRVVRKLPVDMLDCLFLHFVCKSNYFRKERESRAKTASAAPGPSQYFGHGSEIAPRIAANIVPVGTKDLRREKWKIMSAPNPLLSFRMNDFGILAQQRIEFDSHAELLHGLQFIQDEGFCNHGEPRNDDRNDMLGFCSDMICAIFWKATRQDFPLFSVPPSVQVDAQSKEAQAKDRRRGPEHDDRAAQTESIQGV